MAPSCAHAAVETPSKYSPAKKWSDKPVLNDMRFGNYWFQKTVSSAVSVPSPASRVSHVPY